MGKYGENPNPGDERYERHLTEIAFKKSKIRKTDYEKLPEPFESKEESLRAYHLRKEQEEIGTFYTANLFLKEVEKYIQIPTELKAQLLSDYRGFTGMTNPNYVQNFKSGELSKNRIESAFKEQTSEARQLIKDSQ